MAEVVAKSKMHKMQRQKEKKEVVEQTEALDNDLGDIMGLLLRDADIAEKVCCELQCHHFASCSYSKDASKWQSLTVNTTARSLTWLARSVLLREIEPRPLR